MNIIELQDNLKDVSDNVLMKEMQMPSGNMPQFLVLSELTRRRRMREDYNRQMAADMPTVAEEVMTAAGAPQSGITAIARNMAPNSSIAQNTGADMAVQREPTRMPQMMADGGILDLLKNATGRFKGNRTKEDLYRRVEPFPEDGTAAERRNWTLTYGMTHDADGMPKRMLPDVATTDVSPTTDYKSPFISDVSADIGDFMPTVPDASQDPSTDLDIGGILAGAQQFDFDRPFAQQDATGGLPVAAPDFDATDENDILDAEEARLVQQEVLDANKGDQPLPDISQIDPETNLDISAALGIGSLGTNLADAINNPIGDLPFLPPPIPNENRTDVETPLIPEPDRSIDRQINPEKYLDLDDFLAQDSIIPSDEPRFSYPTTPPSGAYPNIALPSDLIGPEAMGGKRSLFNLFPKSTGTVTPEDITKAQTDENAMRSQEESFDQPDKGMIEQIIEDNTTGDGQQNNLNILDTLDTGGTGTGGAVSNPYGALEGRIASMLEERDKSAEADKWLALAQTGLALMASDSPTLAGAIGEAGLVGLSQLRESKSQYDKDILGLLTTQADIDAARRAEDLAERKFGLSEKEFEIAKAEALLPEGLSATEKAAYIKQYGNARSRLREINVALQTNMLSSGEGLERVQIELTPEDREGLLLEKAQLESDVNMFGGLANPAFANIQAAE